MIHVIHHFNIIYFPIREGRRPVDLAAPGGALHVLLKELEQEPLSLSHWCRLSLRTSLLEDARSGQLLRAAMPKLILDYVR